MAHRRLRRLGLTAATGGCTASSALSISSVNPDLPLNALIFCQALPLSLPHAIYNAK
jgi:hypothetical protein